MRLRRPTLWALPLAGAALLSGAARPRPLAARNAHARLESLAPRAPFTRTELTNLGPPSTPAEHSTAPLLSIPAGDYLPFFKDETGLASKTPVAAFRVAQGPVTRQDFLRFVSQNPRWRRSHVQRLFAEATYLADWVGDLDPGSASLQSAQTRISWFAARAYCASVAGRLPSTREWERARSVVGDAFVERTTPGSNLAASLWEWTADFNSVPLATADSNGSVASLFCGAGARATDASDYGAFLRYSFRSSLKADFALKNLGFRCVEATL